MKQFIIKIAKPFYMAYFRYNWRLHNRHNESHAINRFHWRNVNVGKATYGPVEVLYDHGTSRLSIGNYCSIAKGVKFLLGGGHNYRKISTFPFQTKVYNGYGGATRDEKSDIVVEDDVWIGLECIVLAGSRIGKGSVIGARSVVTGIIPPYSVYVGNKVIKMRFPDEVIERIKDVDFSQVCLTNGDAYMKYCNTELSDSNVEEIKCAFTGGIEK